MKLNFAIICDNAFIDKDGRLNIIQTFDTITTAAFPAIHPRLTFVTSHSLYKEEGGNTYIQEVEIISKDSKTIIASAKSKPKETNKDTKNIQFITYFVGLKFEKTTTGIYQIKFKFGENDKDIKEFEVKLIPN